MSSRNSPSRYLNVVLVGRPNTGKSTLFNRFVGSNKAIVSNVPGTTRDRRQGVGYLANLPFQLTDTGGLDDRGSVTGNIKDQVERAMIDADIVFFMIDAKSGVTELDRHFAQWLRKSSSTLGKKEGMEIVVLANKAEGNHLSESVLDTFAEGSRLGLGDPFLVSAVHGDGMADLASIMVKSATERTCFLSTDDEEAYKQKYVYTDTHNLEEEESSGTHKSLKGVPLSSKTINLAIMGKPNVGKSTIMNSILGDERCMVGPIAGLTRDSIEVEWKQFDRNFKLVDTAGLTHVKVIKKHLESKRQHRLDDEYSTTGLDLYDNKGKLLPGVHQVNPEEDPSQFSHQVQELALVNALASLKYAQVILLVVESSQGNFRNIDLQLARKCLEEGRSLAVVANKLDLLNGGNSNGISDDTDGNDNGNNTNNTSMAVTHEMYQSMVQEHVNTFLRDFGHVPVIPVSALYQDNIDNILKVAIQVHDSWSKRVNTWVLNRWLKDCMLTAPQFRSKGKAIKLKYITQISSRPPEFLLFTNVEEVPQTLIRHLRNEIQRDFDLKGTPVRFVVRKSVGNETDKSKLQQKLVGHGKKGRRGVGNDSRGVGPRNRSITIEEKKYFDKQDARRRADTRKKKMVRR